MNETIIAIARTLDRLENSPSCEYHCSTKTADSCMACEMLPIDKAAAIYTAHVKPLEDALAKAEEDKAALVVACNVAAANLEHLLIKQPGGTYFFRYKGGTEKCVAFVRAALARVKESSCPKN